MKKNILFLIISLLFCSYTNGQSFKQDFWAALKAKDMVKAEEILKTWDYADSNDAELYSSFFNFYTVKSLEKDSTVFDKEFAGKALEFISEGIERFPTRFDMRYAKTYMLGQLKDYTSFTNEIISLINYSKKIDNNWKGENFSLLERPVEMLHGAVLEFQERLLAEENTSLYKNIIQISNEMLKCYPDNVQSRLNLSTIYILQKEYDKSLESLLKAMEVDKKNPILFFNIAHVYKLKGDKANAKKYYELTIANVEQKEEKLKVAAQNQLNALK